MNSMDDPMGHPCRTRQELEYCGHCFSSVLVVQDPAVVSIRAHGGDTTLHTLGDDSRRKDWSCFGPPWGILK
jgi:hypothetical protein